MTSSRIAGFLFIVLSTWALMHAYVFWRLGSLPWIAAHFSRRALVITALVMWASYPVARFLSGRLPELAFPVEFLAASWIGLLFLALAALLLIDLVTIGGWVLTPQAPILRGWAAMGALVLALVGTVQALRPPVIRDYEVHLADLPPERDGLVVVALSDLHLGGLIGERWLRHQVERVNALRPDLVALVGDVVDGNLAQVQPLKPVLGQLRAPLGVWAVLGNHEFYAGAESCVELLQQSGISVLRDRWAEPVPGLVLVGVDDLTARGQFGIEGTTLDRTLSDRPKGATVLLSHTPRQTDRAATAGVGLMLCGHTHNGQIWPFSYVVGWRFPLLGGRYQVERMTVVVSRGAGTWGPRMRLWRPGEILRLRLRSGAA